MNAQQKSKGPTSGRRYLVPTCNDRGPFSRRPWERASWWAPPAFGSDGAGRPERPGYPQPGCRTGGPRYASTLSRTASAPAGAARWVESGGGDPQQCLIARSTAPDGSAMD